MYLKTSSSFNEMAISLLAISANFKNVKYSNLNFSSLCSNEINDKKSERDEMMDTGFGKNKKRSP